MNSDSVQGKEALLNFQRLQVPQGGDTGLRSSTVQPTKIILSSHYQNKYWINEWADGERKAVSPMTLAASWMLCGALYVLLYASGAL